MNILVTLYYPESNEARRKELDDCIRHNSLIFDAVLVVSQGTLRPPELDGCGIYWHMQGIKQVVGDLVRFANEIAREDRDPIIVLANTDIMFDPDAPHQMRSYLLHDECYCLTRWEKGELWDVDYSQDAWCFRGCVSLPRAALDVPMAQPGFDNRLSHEVAAAGYKVLNPSKSIRIDHHHESGVVTEYNSQKYRVPLPYLFVRPHFLGQRARCRIGRRLPDNCLRDRDRERGS